MHVIVFWANQLSFHWLFFDDAAIQISKQVLRHPFLALSHDSRAFSRMNWALIVSLHLPSKYVISRSWHGGLSKKGKPSRDALSCEA
jgi:hypothetical protein